MAIQESNKTWKTPELIVLLRSKPEEAVLTACKTQPYQGGAGVTKIHCRSYQVVSQQCDQAECSAHRTS